MDKDIFFESLSFLSKFDNDVWPPKGTEFSLIDVWTDFSLSVEVESGPIFLKNAEDDPAMFACDMVALEPLLGSPSSASTSLSVSQGTPKSHSRRGTSADERAELRSSTTHQQVILRLNQAQAYRVHTNRMLEISLQKGIRTLPDSIVIHFQECSLRLFSMGTQHGLLEVAYDVLRKLPRLSLPENPEPTSPYETVETVTRKLQMLEYNLQDTAKFFLYDKRPLSPTRASHHLDEAASLISYVSTTELDLAMRTQHESFESTQQELEHLLAVYFPRAKQQQHKTEADQLPNWKECIKRAQDLIQKKHTNVEQRHKFSFLPTRG
jgi:hypothetical protein